MTIEKTYFGFRIKNHWPDDINVYKIFSSGREYDIAFSGEIIGKITLSLTDPRKNSLKVIYSRNMNIPETDIAEIALKVIETVNSLN